MVQVGHENGVPNGALVAVAEPAEPKKGPTHFIVDEGDLVAACGKKLMSARVRASAEREDVTCSACAKVLKKQDVFEEAQRKIDEQLEQDRRARAPAKAEAKAKKPRTHDVHWIALGKAAACGKISNAGTNAIDGVTCAKCLEISKSPKGVAELAQKKRRNADRERKRNARQLAQKTKPLTKTAHKKLRDKYAPARAARAKRKKAAPRERKAGLPYGYDEHGRWRGYRTPERPEPHSPTATQKKEAEKYFKSYPPKPIDAHADARRIMRDELGQLSTLQWVDDTVRRFLDDHVAVLGELAWSAARELRAHAQAFGKHVELFSLAVRKDEQREETKA